MILFYLNFEIKSKKGIVLNFSEWGRKETFKLDDSEGTGGRVRVATEPKSSLNTRKYLSKQRSVVDYIHNLGDSVCYTAYNVKF